MTPFLRPQFFGRKTLKCVGIFIIAGAIRGSSCVREMCHIFRAILAFSVIWEWATIWRFLALKKVKNRRVL